MASRQRNVFAPRGRARRRALQGIYQWQLNDQPMRSILNQFDEEQDMAIVDRAYFEDLLLGVEKHLAEIDAGLSGFVDRPLHLVDPIERASLRLAGYELKYRIDVPFKVILNEAVELASDFGAEGGASYVNGVLDKLAEQWRAAEWQDSHKA